mmetsp:Transcript_58483/g.155643  ORF Transcript_58483/g.155643 Transcript_58483/m.155643 type:complete len:242 (-) Transcript_58483:1825-2550(-)
MRQKFNNSQSAIQRSPMNRAPPMFVIIAQHHAARNLQEHLHHADVPRLCSFDKRRNPMLITLQRISARLQQSSNQLGIGFLARTETGQRRMPINILPVDETSNITPQDLAVQIENIPSPCCPLPACLQKEHGRICRCVHERHMEYGPALMITSVHHLLCCVVTQRFLQTGHIVGRCSVIECVEPFGGHPTRLFNVSHCRQGQAVDTPRTRIRVCDLLLQARHGVRILHMLSLQLIVLNRDA